MGQFVFCLKETHRDLSIICICGVLKSQISNSWFINYNEIVLTMSKDLERIVDRRIGLDRGGAIAYIGIG